MVDLLQFATFELFQGEFTQYTLVNHMLYHWFESKSSFQAIYPPSMEDKIHVLIGLVEISISFFYFFLV